MKRTFTTFIFILFSLSLFSQNHKNEYNIGLGVNIGFDNCDWKSLTLKVAS